MGAVTGGLAMLLITQEGEVDGDAVIGTMISPPFFRIFTVNS